MTELNSSPLLSLPPELLHKSLAFADPLDVASFAQTCSAATAFINDSPSLFKELFLILFDAPIQLTDDFHPVEGYNYVVELKRRIAARGVLRSTNESHRNEKLVETVTTFLSIASNPVPPSSSSTTTSIPSRNLSFLNLLSSNGETRLFLHQNFSSDSKEEFISLSSLHRDQITSHLHVLHTPSAMVLDSIPARTAAREIVYDRRNFLKRSEWGPFSNDSTGRVDWVKLEGLSLVMGMNLRESVGLGWDNGGKVLIPLSGRWEDTRPGSAAVTPSKNVGGGEEDEEEKIAVVDRDWAGVESTEWRGTYAFLDYRVWDEFNFRRQRGQRVSLEHEGEAVGDCMSLILKLVDSPLNEDTVMIPPLEEEVRGMGGNGVRTRAAMAAMADARSALGREEDEEDDEEDGDFPTPTSESTDGSDRDLDEDTDYVAPPASTLPAVNNVASTSRTDAFFAPPTTIPPPSPLPSLTPPLYFTGSFSNTFAASQMLDRSIRGSVRLNFEGNVCWRFTIRYGGEDQWEMSGVQVGGVKSRFGILGEWSSSDHDVGGPNGPFWYWPHLD